MTPTCIRPDAKSARITALISQNKTGRANGRN